MEREWPGPWLRLQPASLGGPALVSAGASSQQPRRPAPAYVMMGMMPGRMGTVMPMARQSATNRLNSSTS
jgi:hypothetical protein